MSLNVLDVGNLTFLRIPISNGATETVEHLVGRMESILTISRQEPIHVRVLGVGDRCISKEDWSERSV